MAELLSPARLQPDYTGGHLGPGPIPGHTAGMTLGEDDRVALLEFLRTI